GHPDARRRPRGVAAPRAMPQATSVSLAAQLLNRFTSVTQAVQRAEMLLILQEAINGLDPIGREILALRYFEELANDANAQMRDFKPSAASNRHVRALKRFRDVLKSTPGFFDKERDRHSCHRPATTAVRSNCSPTNSWPGASAARSRRSRST